MSHRPRRIVPDAAKAAICPHQRVVEGPVAIVRQPRPRAVRQLGTCLDCGSPVERVTPAVAFGAWGTISVRRRHLPMGRESDAEDRQHHDGAGVLGRLDRYEANR